MQPESQTFVYRYNYEPRSLQSFISDRYIKDPVKLADTLENRISIGGVKVDANYQLQTGDEIHYIHLRSDEIEVVPKLKVIYEDDELLAISKPNFLPVTPSGRFYFNALAVAAKEIFGNEVLNPLHRLDIETSGVLLFGKSKKANRAFQPLFAEKTMEKRYLALVFGHPEPQTIVGNLGQNRDSKIHTRKYLFEAAKPKTHSELLSVEKIGDYSLVILEPVTGKTNQLRAHMSAIGHSIVGDKKYYPDEEVYLDWYDHRDLSRILPQVKLERQALHCHSMSFTHPFSGEAMTITDDLDVRALWTKELNI